MLRRKIRILIFCFLLTLTGFFSVSAQEVTLSGSIKDTLNKPLEFANVLAIPKSDSLTIVFSITDLKGNYKLRLKKNKPYTIEISYLGYKKQQIPVTISENTEQNIQLTPSNQNLDEVIIDYKQPVIVKQDTLIFRTDVFTDGNEKKLREVLKKLPGVEVDKAGNVTVNGKKVTKFMVEGEVFFTGDTKLGVNNIPADAVEEVIALDNYTDIPFLKGLTDSDVLALNIKLKEGKKKFIFGDIETGAGVKDRYLAHPKLFYYSPKTAINIIGDFNNIGKKSFTLKDYIDFEGGFSIFLENPTGFSSIFNSDFAKSLLNNDFVFNKNNFAAGSIAQKLNKKTQLNAYSIVNASTTQTQTDRINKYNTENQNTLIENRTNSGDEDALFSLNKITLTYTPNIDEDIRLETILKTAKNTFKENIITQSILDTNTVNTTSKPTSLQLLNTFSYNKQFNATHTFSANVTLDLKKNQNSTNRLLSQAPFNDLIPIIEDETIQLSQNTNQTNYTASLFLKHYWVLNNFNHIYPVAGYSFTNDAFSSFDNQIINGNSVSFQNAGFNNDTRLMVNDPFIGLQYKTKLGKFIIKPGFTYHFYNWKITQFSQTQFKKSKGQLLPELLLNWNIKSSEKATLKYNLQAAFNDASYVANRLRLNDFNVLFKGNNTLENTLIHKVSLRYYKFQLLKGLFLNASLTYSSAVHSIQNKTQVQGINRITSLIYTDLPDERISISGSVAKKINKVKFKVSGNTSIANYKQDVNDVIIKYLSNSTTYSLGIETYFKNLPNIEASFNQTLTNFKTQGEITKFVNLFPSITLDYSFLKDLVFKADYTYNEYTNLDLDIKNTFQLANASLIYAKEDSLWSFEFSVRNFFDTRFKNSNTFSEFIITDNRVFIQPRIGLLTISYKL